MAPSTALAFLLLSIGVLSHARWPAHRMSRGFALAAASLAALLGLLVLVQFFAGFDSGLEAALSQTKEFVSGVHLGRMSPLTAVPVLLESAAILLLLHTARWRFAASTAALFAVLGTTLGVVVLVGYAYNAPLLYGRATVPVALSTALAIVFMGVGVSRQALPAIPEMRAWSRNSTRGILLRAFLPVVLLLIFADGWLDSMHWPVNQALWDSLEAILLGALFVALVAWTARRTGDAIERTQEALERSRSLHAESERMGRVGGWEFDIDTQEVVWTEEVYRILEVDFSFQPTLSNGIAFYTPASRPIIERAVQRAIHNHEPFDLELEVVTGPGNLRWVHAIGKTDLKRRKVFGFFQDITERKRAEEALRISEERFKLSMEATSDGLWDWTIQTDGTYFSPAYYRMLGCEAGSFPATGRAWADLIHPDDHEYVLRVNMDCVEGRSEQFECEYRMRARNGEWLWILSRGKCIVRDAKGRAIRLVGTHVNVTERKRAEEALRKNEQYLISIYNTVGDIIFHLAVEPGGQFRFVSVNAAFLRITGLSLGAVVGKTVSEVIPEESLAMVLEKYRQAIEKNTIVVWEETSDYPAGSLTGEVTIAPVFDDQGTCTHLVGSVHDISERKRAEEARRESEERHRAILQTAMDGFWVADTQGRLLEVNDSYCRMSGYSTAELLSMRISDLKAEWTASRAADQSRNLMVQGEDRFESRHRRKDGSIFDVEVSAQYKPVEGGRIVAFLRDNTDQKRAEEAVRASEERWRSIFENSAVGIALNDPEGFFIATNRAFQELVGYTDRELRPLSYLDITYEEDRAASATFGQQLWERKLPQFTCEKRYRGKHGDLIWARTTVSIVPAGETAPRFAVAIVQDITERKRAEEALRQSADRLALILEATSDGVWDWYIPSGDVVFGPRYARLLGYDPEDFFGNYKSWRGLVHPDDIERINQHLSEHFAGHSDYSIEFRMREKSGNWHWVHSRGLVIERDEEGRPVRMVGTNSDIQERQRAEEERNSLQLQLAQAHKMESIGRLAGGIAHDFGNLMGVILLHADSAFDELQTGDPLIEPLTEIRKAAERAASLTQHLLAFSRKQMLQTKVLNLNSVVDSSQAMLRRLIGENINLEVLPGSELGFVKADPAQLEQIIMNLAVNSRDAMPQGGKLTIETANVELEESYVRQHPGLHEGSYVTLTVRDTGMGMDREALTRAFDPFFTTKEVGKGTGLGLSIVYGIVKQSKGYVTIQSEQGCGTEFKVYLPRVLERPEPVRASEIVPEQGGFETILVAEDEPALRKPICKLLEDAGYQVLVGKDVDEAIQIATQHKGPLDLLLTDVVMPEMSGPQLAQHLQLLYPRMKVLYMSGYPEPRQPNSTLASEVDFIQKPFTKETLLRRLREVLVYRKSAS